MRGARAVRLLHVDLGEKVNIDPNVAYWVGVAVGAVGAIGISEFRYRAMYRRLRRDLKWCAAWGAALHVEGDDYCVMRWGDVLIHREVKKTMDDYYAGHLIEPHTGQGAASRKALERWNRGNPNVTGY